MQSLAAGGISFAEQVARLSRQHAAAKLGAGATEQSVSVEVAGHSLGSALATYYVMENALTHKIKNPAICTFASPKVGDSIFTDAFNKLGLRSWRVANLRDIVPKLPPGFFCHVNSEALIDSTGKAGPGLKDGLVLRGEMTPAMRAQADNCRSSLAYGAVPNLHEQARAEPSASP